MEKNILAGMLLEGVFFENWLRFYFLAQDDTSGRDEIIIHLSGNEVQTLVPSRPLPQKITVLLNRKPVLLERSREAILHCVRETAGTGANEKSIREIIESSGFQEELARFQGWISLHENLLPRLDFDRWIRLFEDWKLRQSATRQ